MSDFWQTTSAQLERELTPQQYRTWIKPLSLVSYDETVSTVRISAPNRFKLDWVKSQFSNRITELARQYLNQEVQVLFVLNAQTPTTAHSNNIVNIAVAKNENLEPDIASSHTESANNDHSLAVRSKLNPNLTFET